MIEATDLHFSYNKKGANVLDGISIKCAKGSVNILLGLNGCGKTTLIKILAGIYRPKTGSIMYCGRDFLSMSVEEKSTIVSYVPQASSSVNDFSVIDYLTFGTVNSLEFYESPGQAELEKVNGFIERFGIGHLANKRMSEISGGERQIVSICSAMIQNTDVILLDEPMSALDMRNQDRVLSLLKNMVTEEGKTILLSTHNPNHALYLGGQVYTIKDGTIMDSGPASEVVTVGRLRELYGDRICYSKDFEYNEISFR